MPCAPTNPLQPPHGHHGDGGPPLRERLDPVDNLHFLQEDRVEVTRIEHWNDAVFLTLRKWEPGTKFPTLAVECYCLVVRSQTGVDYQPERAHSSADPVDNLHLLQGDRVEVTRIEHWNDAVFLTLKKWEPGTKFPTLAVECCVVVLSQTGVDYLGPERTHSSARRLETGA